MDFVRKGVFLSLVGTLIALSSSRSQAAGRSDLFVTQIVIHPLQPNVVFAVTTYSIGVIKSVDGGGHWSLINEGIKSYSLYHFAVHPKDVNTVYLGAGGGGLYKSGDGGNHWVEMNDGLQDTDIGQLLLHPRNPARLYVVCATGVYRSPDGGQHWEAWNQGDNFTSSQEFQNIVIMTGTPDRYFLASKHGLFTRTEADPAWGSASKELEGKLISALAVDPSGRRLFAAVLRNGQTLQGGGLFVSEDFGVHWKSVGKGVERDWIRVIRFDAADSNRIYLATANRGVLVSLDEGQAWKESNRGMEATDLRALSLDPLNPKILYAGAHGEGIFKSTDGAASWARLDEIPRVDSRSIISRLTTPGPNQQKPQIMPPPSFAKCNKCHGWTDPEINSSNGFWLVPPNRRDWGPTVRRMSQGAGLTPEEEKAITEFLQAYSERYGGP